MPDLTPAEATGFQIMDSLDPETKAKLDEWLAEQEDNVQE